MNVRYNFLILIVLNIIICNTLAYLITWIMQTYLVNLRTQHKTVCGNLTISSVSADAWRKVFAEPQHRRGYSDLANPVAPADSVRMPGA